MKQYFDFYEVDTQIENWKAQFEYELNLYQF